jgi:hypothetical protein
MVRPAGVEPALPTARFGLLRARGKLVQQTEAASWCSKLEQQAGAASWSSHPITLLSGREAVVFSI